MACGVRLDSKTQVRGCLEMTSGVEFHAGWPGFWSTLLAVEQVLTMAEQRVCQIPPVQGTRASHYWAVTPFAGRKIDDGLCDSMRVGGAVVKGCHVIGRY